MKNRGEEVDRCDDLMAVFMKEMANRKYRNDAGHFFNEKQCCFLLSDLFGAGVETTVNTLRWFLLYMALNKDVQVRQICTDTRNTKAGICKGLIKNKQTNHNERI